MRLRSGGRPLGAADLGSDRPAPRLCLCYGEEGAYDGAGRWRRRHLRHYLAGSAVDRVRALAMAEHFCSSIRHLARAYSKARGKDGYYRDSFENGCADALVLRLAVAARNEGRGGVLSTETEL